MISFLKKQKNNKDKRKRKEKSVHQWIFLFRSIFFRSPSYLWIAPRGRWDVWSIGTIVSFLQISSDWNRFDSDSFSFIDKETQKQKKKKLRQVLDLNLKCDLFKRGLGCFQYWNRLFKRVRVYGWRSSSERWALASVDGSKWWVWALIVSTWPSSASRLLPCPRCSSSAFHPTSPPSGSVPNRFLQPAPSESSAIRYAFYFFFFFFFFFISFPRFKSALRLSSPG